MMMHVHLIGIGGTGLSAIAKVLIERGYKVSGSDSHASIYFNAITELGATTYLGHEPGNVMGADVVVRSSAIPDNNPEVIAARNCDIPVLKRSEFLQQLTDGQTTLAVAGTHGKTTTTGMLITILKELHQDPSFILGALLKPFDTNASAGSGQYFVIEADEYDRMFLGLNPQIAVVTNIEHDHPDCFPTLQKYLDAFSDFLMRVHPTGTALLCTDDPGVQELLREYPQRLCKVITFGLNEDADLRAVNCQVGPTGLPEFDAVHQVSGQAPIALAHIRLSIPGEHNIRNALSALAVSHLLGLDDTLAAQALSAYQGTERRFEIRGCVDGIIVVDDYAHHPTQIRITLQAAHQRFPNGRVWVVWEPHTYSRPAALHEAYVQALNLADQVVITRVYAAREVDNGYTPEPIAAALPADKARYIPDYDALINFLAENLVESDVVLVLSAGYGPLISSRILDSLIARKEQGRRQDE